MGSYPLFACRSWAELGEDLESLSQDLVAVSLVADPLAPLAEGELQKIFDHVLPFKQHYLVDLSLQAEAGSRHHRYYGRRALKQITVEECDPAEAAEDLISLYGALARRFRLTGMSAFSAFSLRSQLQVPGAIVFRAIGDGRLIGIDMWYAMGSVAYLHLSTMSRAGYEVGASYGLKLVAIRELRERFAIADLGGTSGLADADDGLASFKRGWSTHTAQAFFCGKVLDHLGYDALCADLPSTQYFPAYRAGEFR